MNYYDKGMSGRPEKFVLPSNLVMPEGRFEGSSTYEGTYVGGRMDRREQVRPENNLGVGAGRFDGTTSYTIDYDPLTDGPRYLGRQNQYTGSKK